MQARPTKGAMASILAVGLLVGCGASPGSGAGSTIRLPHDGWRVYRVALNPSGTEVAVFGDAPGGTAT